jgi:tetratricopeptide (TPR) repeat protein
MDRCYGREKEIGLLEKTLKERSSLTLLCGEKGIGKSTILRHFHLSLLRRPEIVVGYTKVYRGRDPFSHLFAYLLVSLYDNLTRIGRRVEFSPFFSSLRSHLEGLGKTRAGKALLFNVRSILLANEFRDLLRLSRPLWDEFRFEEAMVDPIYGFSKEHILSFIKGFDRALREKRIVLIIDDVDSILEERPDIFDAMMKPMGNIHLLFSIDDEVAVKMGLKGKKGINLIRIGPLDRDGVEEWMENEAPSLLRSIGVDELIRLSKGFPFTLSEWIKQEVRPEDLQKGSLREGLDFVDRIFAEYDYPNKRLITKVALMRYPLSISEYARLFGIGEDATRRYFMRFEDDFLVARAYLEGENVFWFEHPLKQQRVIELAKDYLNLDELYEEIASFFEREISYPTEEDGFRFWGNLRSTIYYYGLIDDERSLSIKDFYDEAFSLFIKGKGRILRLMEHPYFKGLKTKLKLMIYTSLAQERRKDPYGFKEALSGVDRFISERKGYLDFQIEYGRALFYLSNLLGREGGFEEIDLVVERFSSLVYEHPDIKELKVIFSSMLFNLSYDLAAVQRFDRAKGILDVMGRLLHRNPEEMEIRLSYMKILSNICYRIGEAGRFGELPAYIGMQRSILRMDGNPDEIKLEHAKTLCNASLHLGRAKRFKDIEWVLDSLRDLGEENPDMVDIRCEYARALSNASSLYGEAKRFEDSGGLIEALATLSVKEDVSKEMREAYVSSLFNISSDLGKAKRFDLLGDILKRMREVALKAPIQDEILIAYAKTLYNASYDLGERGMFEELLSNLTQLIGLFKKTPHPEIEILCFRTIFNAIEDLTRRRRFEDISRMLSTIENLKGRRLRHPQTPELVSQILFNLASHLSKNLQIGNLRRSLALLKEVTKQDRVKIYLDALVNVAAHIGKSDKIEEFDRIMEELEGLSREVDGGSIAYTRALANAANTYGRKGLFKRLEEVIERAERLYKEDPEVKDSYMDVLVNASVHLARMEDLGALRALIRRLDGFCHKVFPGDEVVVIAYTKTLVILYNELEKRGELEEMNKVAATLEEVAKQNASVMALLEAIEFPLY